MGNMEGEFLAFLMTWIGMLLDGALFLLLVWGLVRTGRWVLVWLVAVLVLAMAFWGYWSCLLNAQSPALAYGRFLVVLVLPAVLGGVLGALLGLYQRRRAGQKPGQDAAGSLPASVARNRSPDLIDDLSADD